MTVEDKIIFAEYFLDKIRNAQTREDFHPNFSAFLSETKSIADYLLEDYNLQFGLRISYITAKTFKDKACDTMNLDALKFISTYNNKLEKVHENELANYLFKKRNTDVHKKSEPVRGNFSRGMIDSVTWEFLDYDNKDKDVVTLCEEFLNLMKKFVHDMKTEH